MSDWFVRPAPRPSPACRLLCLPHAGAGPSSFFQWPELLSPKLEVCAIQLPGHGARIAQPAYRDVRALVTDLHAAIAPLADVPIALFGHSMGALVAFELAREARRHNTPLRWLFVSAYAAPQLPWDGTELHAATDDEFMAGLATWYPAQEPSELELMRAMLPTLRADFEVCERYRYREEPPLSIPISAFGGISDTEVPKSAIESWSAQTSAPFKARMLPGDHLFYLGSPQRLLRVIDKELE